MRVRKATSGRRGANEPHNLQGVRPPQEDTLGGSSDMTAKTCNDQGRYTQIRHGRVSGLVEVANPISAWKPVRSLVVPCAARWTRRLYIYEFTDQFGPWKIFYIPENSSSRGFLISNNATSSWRHPEEIGVSCSLERYISGRQR